MRRALALASPQLHPGGLGHAVAHNAIGCIFRHDYQGCQKYSEAWLALAHEKDVADYLAWAKINRGYALAMQGKSEAGLAEIRGGLALTEITGAAAGMPYLLGLQAEALMEAKRIEEGLASLDEALTIINSTGECPWEAEVYRLKGELLLVSKASDTSSAAGDQQVESEACFQKAIEVARRQQARSLELRATMSLARLWRQQGKTAEGHRMLAEIYGWFTEGFDTADLKDARALLRELQQRVAEDSLP